MFEIFQGEQVQQSLVSMALRSKASFLFVGFVRLKKLCVKKGVYSLHFLGMRVLQYFLKFDVIESLSLE